MINDTQNLSGIGVGAHDEMPSRSGLALRQDGFQAGKHVLVGMDVAIRSSQNAYHWPVRPKTKQYDWLTILRHRFYDVETAVRQIMAETPRASSLVENLNSRLRNYFFLRRYIGNGYLDLLRFFLNHRRYIRSDRPERVGKSPAELLNSRSHPHWLELLGYQRFGQN